MLLVLFATIVVFTIVASYKKSQEFIYVHLKTGTKYRVIQECLMKFNGEWMDAVAYESVDTNEMFVREYNDFVLNFKTLSQWKKTE